MLITVSGVLRIELGSGHRQGTLKCNFANTLTDSPVPERKFDDLIH